MKFNFLHTAVAAVVILVCAPQLCGCAATSFIDFSNISITPVNMGNGKWGCEVSSNLNMVKVRCDNCFLIGDIKVRAKGGDKEVRYIELTSNGKTDVMVDIENGDVKYQIPFNVSCDSRDFIGTEESKKATTTIKHIQIYPSSVILNLSEMKGVMKYFALYTEESESAVHFAESEGNRMEIRGLKQKTRYQFCVNSFDWYGISGGRYSCSKAGTDFSETGPVTELQVQPESEMVRIQWEKPTYVLDRPQKYVVTYQTSEGKRGGNGEDKCKSIIIHMVISNVITSNNSKCSVSTILKWQSLKNLTIKGLKPFTEYILTVVPFNGRRTRIEKKIIFKTDEGESGPVENLVIRRKDEKRIIINFSKPLEPNGNIMVYRMEIWIVQPDICGRFLANYEVKQIKNTSYAIPYRVCTKYRVMVTPINGWKKYSGFGQSTSHNYTTEDTFPKVEKVSVKYISYNLVKVNWKLVKAIHCNIRAIIIHFSDPNSGHCMLMGIYSDPLLCDRLNKTMARQGCGQSPDSVLVNNTMSMETFVHMGWPYQALQVTLSLMTGDKVHLGVKSNTAYGDGDSACNSDCVTTQEYVGIRSADKLGRPCIMWDESRYKAYNGRSNYCMISGTDPWCPTATGYGYCSILQCTKVRTVSGCVGKVQLSSTEYSISGTWADSAKWNSSSSSSSMLGYLVLIHDEDGVCVAYTLQTRANEEKLSISVRNMYISCRKKGFKSKVNYAFEFTDLYNNAQYNLYLMPIIDKSNIGSVRKVKLRTKLAVPSSVTEVVLLEKGLHYLTYKWAESIQSQYYGEADGYRLVLEQKHIVNVSTKSTVTEHQFQSLEQCTEYCLRVLASNKAGESGLSRKVCAITRAPRLDDVDISEVDRGYSTSKQVSWSYIGADRCPKQYRIDYRPYYSNQSDYKVKFTNSTRVQLTGLQLNMFYEFLVTATSIVGTENGRNESVSKLHRFYTGNEKIEIDSFNSTTKSKRRILIFHWKLKHEDVGCINKFYVTVQDPESFCLLYLLLRCTDCLSLPNENSDRRINLLQQKCQHTINGTFNKENRNIDVEVKLPGRIYNYSLGLYGDTRFGLQLLYRQKFVYTVGEVKVDHFSSVIYDNMLRLTWKLKKYETVLADRYLVKIITIPNNECKGIVKINCNDCGQISGDAADVSQKLDCGKKSIYVATVNYSEIQSLFNFALNSLNQSELLEKSAVELYARLQGPRGPYTFIGNTTIAKLKTNIGFVGIMSIICVIVVLLILATLIFLFLCRFSYRHPPPKEVNCSENVNLNPVSL